MVNSIRLVALTWLALVTSALGDEAAKRDADGIRVHTLHSSFQDGPTKVRVLLPSKLEKGHRYRVLYVLPVEARDGAHYGDGLREVQRLGLHDKYGLICVMPTFARTPWYADHPTSEKIRQESYLLEEVLPLVERNYQVVKEREDRLLLGFSKSGWGAFSLLLRHPTVFGKAAAWDAPLDLNVPGKYGSGEIFGTRDNFQKYEITRLLKERAGRLGKDKRLILLGYGNFRSAHQAAHALMEQLRIEHEYRDGPSRRHDWRSGWEAEAVGFLVEPGAGK